MRGVLPTVAPERPLKSKKTPSTKNLNKTELALSNTTDVLRGVVPCADLATFVAKKAKDYAEKVKINDFQAKLQAYATDSDDSTVTFSSMSNSEVDTSHWARHTLINPAVFAALAMEQIVRKHGKDAFEKLTDIDMEPLELPFEVDSDQHVNQRLPTFGAPDSANVIPDGIYVIRMDTDGNYETGLTVEYKNRAIFDKIQPHLFWRLLESGQTSTSNPVVAAKFIWPMGKKVATLEGMEFFTNSETRILCQVSLTTCD